MALGRAVPCTSLLPACSPPLCGMGRAPGLATMGQETGSSVGRAQRGNDETPARGRSESIPVLCSSGSKPCGV